MTPGHTCFNWILSGSFLCTLVYAMEPIQNGLFEVFKAILAFTATQTDPFALQKPFNRNPHD